MASHPEAVHLNTFPPFGTSSPSFGEAEKHAGRAKEHALHESGYNHGPGGPAGDRHCFVTVGATAPFRQLLEDVLSPDFLEFMSQDGFEHMTVQCGADLAWARDRLERLNTFGIRVDVMDYTADIKEHMLLCRGEYKRRLAGCVISHAGAGTILDAMRLGTPLVVVPNKGLLNNHQEELAEEVARARWAIHGEIGELTDAIVLLRSSIIEGRMDHLAPYQEPPFPTSHEERCTLFDWMVLTC